MPEDMTNKVWYLERALFSRFPRETAEKWDNPGLIVGDAEDEITGIAVALDVSTKNIQAAHDAGCNVLLTHHPVFISAPSSIIANGPDTWRHHGVSGDSVEQASSGILVHEAIRLGISLIAMHTNFDVSPEAQHVLPGALGLTYLNPMEQTSSSGQSVGAGSLQGGLGQLCSTDPMSLEDLAKRCKQVFGVTPRAWGDPEQLIRFVVTIPGSAWPLINDATQCGFDCCICGETRYHTALAAVASGNSIIELGHDISENLFADSFRDILQDLGYSNEIIHRLPATTNWWTV